MFSSRMENQDNVESENNKKIFDKKYFADKAKESRNRIKDLLEGKEKENSVLYNEFLQRI